MQQIRIQRLAFAWLLLLSLAITNAYAANLDSHDELEAFFDGAFAIQLNKYRVPGATVAVVKDGEILFSKGYGFANLETKTPMNPETSLHRPGSNSKILVWTAVMQLMEQGRLDLYTDINTYLDFSIPSKVASGKEVPPITLHHLLTHTAGFEDEVTQVFVSSPDLIQPLGQYVKNHLPDRVFAPGSMMAYSNYGTTLAAYIVELVSGRPFDIYVQENILGPLAMVSSTFDQPLPENLAAQMSEGYRYEAGRFLPGGFEYVQAYPAGGLTSTTQDMARLIIAQLSLGLTNEEAAPSEERLDDEDTDQETTPAETPKGRILQEETAVLMQTQQFSGHPEIPGMTYGLIEANYNGHRVLAHGGDTLLFTTGLYFLPEENVGLYVAYNAAVGDGARRSLLEGFMDRYFPLTSAQQTVPRPVTTGTEKNYEGVFHNARSSFTGVESILRFAQPLKARTDQDGYLTLSAYGETTRYGEIAPGLFQELNGQHNIALSFEDGQVTKIHFPGPITWVRAPWYQSSSFLASLLGISVLFMVITILGWIRTLFKPQNRRRGTFIVPKILGVLFILLLVTITVLLAEIITTVHPTLGIPLLVLEPSSTLNAVIVLSNVLMGIGTLMLVVTIYLAVTKRGHLWKRIHYALLTLSGLSVILVLWQMNLF